MEHKPLFLMLASIIAMLSGFVYSYSYPLQTGMLDVPLTVIVMGLFLGGLIYFGYFTFIPALIFGLQLGADKNAAIFIYIVPAIVALYAGALLGAALEEDFRKKASYLNHGKQITVFIIIALVIGFAIEQAMPSIMAYWPADFLGMNMLEGKSATSMIGELSRLIRPN